MVVFQERVWALVKMIPKGRLSTYKLIAIALGNPNAFRAVGNACSKNPFAPKVPCHRVIKSNGCIGGYAKGTAKKIALLECEGIKIKKGKAQDFSKRLFRFKSV